MANYIADFVPTVLSSTTTVDLDIGVAPDQPPAAENDWDNLGPSTRLRYIDGQYVTYQANAVAYASRLLVAQSFVNVTNGQSIAANIASDATIGGILFLLDGQIVSTDVNEGYVAMFAGIRGDTLYSASSSLFYGEIPAIDAMSTYAMSGIDLSSADGDLFTGLSQANAKTVLRGDDGELLLKLMVTNEAGTAYDFSIDRITLRIGWSSETPPPSASGSGRTLIRLPGGRLAAARSRTRGRFTL